MNDKETKKPLEKPEKEPEEKKKKEKREKIERIGLPYFHGYIHGYSSRIEIYPPIAPTYIYAPST